MSKATVDTRATIERLRGHVRQCDIPIERANEYLTLLDRLEKLERVAVHSRYLDKELEEHVQAGDIPPLAEIYDVRYAIKRLDKKP